MLDYNGIRYQTHPEVYEPAEDTFLFAENLQVERKDNVLEIGTGTGLIAIIASRGCRTVTATDVNPQAIDCAVKNIIANKAYNIELRKGNLFEPVQDEKFDLILFNTPYLPTDEDERVDDELDAAWNGGVDGREVIDQFLEGLKDHLKPGGRVQLVQSSLSNVERTLEKLEEMGFDAAVTAREKFFFEEVVVITGVLPS
ncbi:HemK2/MTQ2 family protein methyltransferase [Methanobacterium petrolearium]|uniref:HemK2/MTQ2 family protein methyltransferase n=1 Tax=Methanobacterium petrolearium TaxID=710190 RepID=UPI001AE750A1|nr:HemK2/MTQ2 family protein methyltransferase [Methanobacterium petrolearium]MBP1944717.1 release factor glutamine methyltransferase [Methanobacterium petrolearium]BDZ69982.1 methyltransferase [Methanobacterium petrolearium]